MSATYTFDVFSSLDGFGSVSGGDWFGFWRDLLHSRDRAWRIRHPGGPPTPTAPRQSPVTTRHPGRRAPVLVSG